MPADSTRGREDAGEHFCQHTVNTVLICGPVWCYGPGCGNQGQAGVGPLPVVILFGPDSTAKRTAVPPQPEPRGSPGPQGEGTTMAPEFYPRLVTQPLHLTFGSKE